MNQLDDLCQVDADNAHENAHDTSAEPGEKSKVIYLMRHAQAHHNVEVCKVQREVKERGGSKQDQEAARQKVLLDPQFLDASLTEGGLNQGERARKFLEDSSYPYPDVVLVSPLERALHTASILFPNHPKVIALEILREKRSGRPCDERKPAVLLQREFPNVDFTYLLSVDNQSNAGISYNSMLHEDNTKLRLRSCRLLALLNSRESVISQEAAIAIVTHKGFLRELLNGPLLPLMPESNTQLTSAVFGNAEVRVLEVVYDSTHHITRVQTHLLTESPAHF
jgi:broad specificity phosphatase PhoE